MYKKVKRRADYVFHPPVGTNVPGKVDANPYMNYPPDQLKSLLKTIKDGEELKKILSAIKQWDRLYMYPGYPWKIFCARLRRIAKKLAELDPPAQNIPYYQDVEVPTGYETIWDSLQSPQDNYDEPESWYGPSIKGPAERPVKDVDFFRGDFLTPKEPVFDAVSPRGDGPDPEDMDPDPPTGGNIDGFPQGIWS